MFERRKKQKREAEASAAALADAFAQLDLFGGRLDELKQSYNDQAKQLAAIPTPVPPPPSSSKTIASKNLPPPALAFQPYVRIDPEGLPPPTRPEGPKPEGRYSSVKKPPQMTVPRPSPPVLPPPLLQRTRSGRFYLQLAAAATTEAMRKVREQVSSLGRVVDSGQGTASDPDAGWVEIAVREEDTRSLMGKLADLGVKDQLERLVEVSAGEGRLQARQFELFRKKMDSGSDNR